MDLYQDAKLRQAAASGKYKRLFMRLVNSNEDKLRMIFEDVEEILGFRLPTSARLYSAWWANEEPGGRHTQALAWTAAGWKTSDVDVDTETLVFVRKNSIHRPRTDRSKIDLEAFHVHHAELLTNDWTFSREDMYEDRM